MHAFELVRHSFKPFNITDCELSKGSNMKVLCGSGEVVWVAYAEKAVVARRMVKINVFMLFHS